MSEKVKNNSSITISKAHWDLSRFYTVFILIAIFVVFSMISPMFCTSRNIMNLLRQISMLTIAACGLTICRAAGELDLSVGGLAALTGITIAKLMVSGTHPLLAFIVTLLVGVVFGIINGFLVAIVRVPSLIATLGTMSVASGLALTVTDGKAIYARFPQGFTRIGAGYLGPIPFPVVILMVIVIVTFVMLERTALGRHLYAVGENPLAARLAGLRVTQLRILAFVLSSVLATIAGVMLVARLGSGQPTAGGEYLLEGLGAVFIGMTTFHPGRANVLGTLCGALMIGFISNGLLLMGFSPYIQDVIKGIVMILAVIAAVYKEEIRL